MDRRRWLFLSWLENKKVIVLSAFAKKTRLSGTTGQNDGQLIGNISFKGVSEEKWDILF